MGLEFEYQQSSQLYCWLWTNQTHLLLQVFEDTIGVHCVDENCVTSRGVECRVLLDSKVTIDLKEFRFLKGFLLTGTMQQHLLQLQAPALCSRGGNNIGAERKTTKLSLAMGYLRVIAGFLILHAHRRVLCFVPGKEWWLMAIHRWQFPSWIGTFLVWSFLTCAAWDFESFSCGLIPRPLQPVDSLHQELQQNFATHHGLIGVALPGP